MSDETTRTPEPGAGPANPDPPTPNPPAPEPTLAELKDRAKALEVAGRSSMNREELEAAIAEAEASHAPQTAFAGVMGALFNTADVARPATDEEVGRPPLLEVAEARAAARSNRNRNR